LRQYDGDATDIVIPQSVNAIGEFVFDGKTVNSLTTHSGVKRILDSAFYQCAPLDNVTLAEGLEFIDAVAFWNSGIKTLNLPEGVTTIGEFAFVDEKGWERMLLEDEIYEAPPLEMLTIPDSVRRIETYALAYCRNLTELSIPDSVNYIGDRAFEGCEALESVKLPGGLKELGEFAFFLCDKLREISIPAGITHICPGTFFGCSLLRRVDIPNTVVSIGKEAFMNCGSLRKITIPEGVEEIGESAFQGCSKLEKVVIPESVKSIGQNALLGALPS
jgi:hypothetical protein